MNWPPWPPELTAPIVAGLLSGVGSSVLTSWLQHWYWRKQHREQSRDERRSWKLQRADEIRLAAISDFNRALNTFLAVRVSQTGTIGGDWLRDVNICAFTIRALFSDAAYGAAKQINDTAAQYRAWEDLGTADRNRLADELAAMCHEALRILYREVIEPESEQWP